MSTLKLKGGTLVHVDGLPVTLGGDTDVECAQEHFDALREHSTVPFQEYPKVSPDGRTVNSAAEEAPAVVAETPEPEPEPEPVSPLDDVTIEMDNPAFQPPKKSTHKKK